MLFNEPVIKTVVLSIIEKQLNSVLTLDPVSLVQLGKIAGAVIDVQCSEPLFQCYVYIEKQSIRLVGYHEGDTDLSIRGSVSSLLGLVTHRDQAIDNVPEVELLGNRDIVDRLSAIHQSVNLDWEALFCQCFGDVGGHILAKGCIGLSDQIKKISKTTVENCQEYLQEELSLLPSKNEFDAFSDDMAELQKRVVVLAKKIEDLKVDREAGV